MRRVLLTCVFAYAMSGYASQQAIPVQSTVSRFHPVVLQENYYIPSRPIQTGLVDLFASLRRVVSHKNMWVTVIHNKALTTQANAVLDYLFTLGMEKERVVLVQQAYPLYPLYVVVKNFGKESVYCHFSYIDEVNTGLQDLVPCYLENNRRVQAVF